MKTSLVSSLLASLAISMAAPLNAEVATSSLLKSTPAIWPGAEIALDSVAARIHVNGDRVTPGTSRIMVSMRLGRPNAVLADGSWLYRGYDARRVIDAGDDEVSGRDLIQSGTLVVRFNAGKVTSLSLADEPALVALKKESHGAHPPAGRFAAE